MNYNENKKRRNRLLIVGGIILALLLTGLFMNKASVGRFFEVTRRNASDNGIPVLVWRQ